MANEFGNAGAISRSQTRLNNKKVEELASIDGAEWEVFYNEYWRDISSDYEWDVTLAGNTILRAIRWDDNGFRSYREDRGLILRKKTDDEEGGDDGSDPLNEADDGDVFEGGGRTGRDILSSFAKSAGISFGVGLANEAYQKILEPKLNATKLGQLLAKKPLSPVGKFLSANKVTLGFAAYNFLTSKDSTQDKLINAALNVGTGLLVKRIFGPASIVVFPLIGFVQNITEGETFGEAGAELAGSFFGRGLSGKVSTSLSNKVSNGRNIKILNQPRRSSINQSYQPGFGRETLQPLPLLQKLTNITQEANPELSTILQNQEAAKSASMTNALKSLSHTGVFKQARIQNNAIRRKKGGNIFG